MGYSISWLAFAETTKSHALERASLRDLGTDDAYHEAPYSCGAAGTWAVVFSNDIAYASHELALALSVERLVIACQVEEHASVVAVHAHLRERTLWTLWCDSEGADTIEADGEVSAGLFAMIERLRAKRRPEAGLDEFDLLVDVARELTGFRHDEETAAGANFTAAGPLA